MNCDSANNSIHNIISTAEKVTRKRKRSRHHRKCTGRSLKVRCLRQGSKDYFRKKKALQEANLLKHEVQEVLHKILQNVAQNLNPAQQTSNVLNDFVQRALQDTATSDVTSTVSPNINASNTASSVSLKSSCTRQTVFYKQPSTSSLASSASTLPVVVCPIQGSSGMRVISNYDSSTLPLVPIAGQTTKRQRVSKSFAKQKISSLTKEEVLPLDSTSVQPKQRISKFIAEQKISGLAKKVIFKRLPNIPKQATIRGRRIINFEYFFNSLKCVNNHSNYGCSLNDMIVTGEEKKGMYTTFKLKCTVCGFRKAIYSESTSKRINADFIVGMMSIKCGFEAMNKLLRKLNLPSLTDDFFINECDKILLNKRNRSDKETMQMLKEVAQTVAEDYDFNIVHKTSNKFKKLGRPRTAPHQVSGLPKKTCQQTKISEKESLFQNVDLSHLVVEEQIDVKEEINDNVHENDFEAIPPETIMKTCEDNVKEQESINMTIIKREINSDADDDEDLIGSKTCEMETLDKESSSEYNDQSKQMLQQKKVRTYEDKMIVNQEQVALNKFPAIGNVKNDSNLVEPEFNSIEVKKPLSFISKVNQTSLEFDNQPETEFPPKKNRTVKQNRVAVNQKDIKLSNKRAKQNYYSVINYESLSKPPKIKNKKRAVQRNRSKTNRPVTATSSTFDGKKVFLIPVQYVHKVKENSVVMGPQISPDLTNEPHDGISRAAFIPATSTIFQQQTGESNNLLLSLISKDAPSVNNCSTSSQNPLIILPGARKTTYIVHAPAVTQQPTNLPNSGPIPSTSGDSRWTEQENMINDNPSFILPDEVPKDVSDPIPLEPHIDQYHN